jgi:hypothetical protein
MLLCLHAPAFAASASPASASSLKCLPNTARRRADALKIARPRPPRGPLAVLEDQRQPPFQADDNGAILLLLYFQVDRHTRDTRRRSSNLTGTKTCATPYHVPASTTTTNQPAPAPTSFSSAVIAKTTDEQSTKSSLTFIIN